MGLIHQPKQQRSLETQEKVLGALERMLETRFFGEITTREIAAEAGVSPATLYRRFKDKDALLPVLLARFDARLNRWTEEIWSRDTLRRHATSKARVIHVVRRHVSWFAQNAAVLRTLYLYLRLHPEIDLEYDEGPRIAAYVRMLQPILEALENEGRTSPGEPQFKLFVLVLLSATRERVLFVPLMRSGKVFDLSERAFVAELSEVLWRYVAA